MSLFRPFTLTLVLAISLACVAMPTLAARSDTFLGNGFTSVGRDGLTPVAGQASNGSVSFKRGGEFAQGGIGQLNALFYNVKDAFKYIVGSLAILWMLISAFQIVTATSDDGINAGKQGIMWATIGVVAVFVIDLVVVAFFEGGSQASMGTAPGTSLIDMTTGLFNKVYAQEMAYYFTNNIRAVFEFMKVWGSALAILAMFAVGFWMVTAAEDTEAAEKGKKYLTHLVTAFVVFHMIDAFIFHVVYPVNIKTGLNDPECLAYLSAAQSGTSIDLSRTFDQKGCRSAAELTKQGSDYIHSLMRFFSTILGSVAVFFIVYSGVRIVASLGDEEVISAHKKHLLYALIGLIIILIGDRVITQFFFPTDFNTGTTKINVYQGLIEFTGIVNYLISFVGIFALLGMIYAGVLWVVNFGDSEMAEKSKKIIVWSIIAIILSISAYAIINTILGGKSNAITTSGRPIVNVNSMNTP